MHAMATFTPKLEWPRDKQIAPPIRINALFINLIDGLLDNFLALVSCDNPAWRGALLVEVPGCIASVVLLIASNSGGTFK